MGLLFGHKEHIATIMLRIYSDVSLMLAISRLQMKTFEDSETPN